MKNFYQKGMTVMEMLIVVFILGVLVSVALPQFSTMKKNQVLKNTTGDIVSTLHSAQSQSLASVDSSEYGVHFQSNQIVIFKGETFLSGAQSNNIISIVSPASISNVTLGGISSSTGDVYFERLSGIPSKTGTITVSTSSATGMVTISATGAVSIN